MERWIAVTMFKKEFGYLDPAEVLATEWIEKIYTVWNEEVYTVCTIHSMYYKFYPRCAAWSRWDIVYMGRLVRQTTNQRAPAMLTSLQTTRLLDFTNSEIWLSRKLVCRLRTTCSCSLVTSLVCSCVLQVYFTPSFFYHGIAQISTFVFRPQHRSYRCWRLFK